MPTNKKKTVAMTGPPVAASNSSQAEMGRIATRLRGEWRKDLDMTKTHVRQMVEDRGVFLGVFDIVRQHPMLVGDALVPNWIIANYVARMALAIRSQVDRDGQSVSLVRLLESIKQNSWAISRSAFIESRRDSLPAISAAKRRRPFDAHFTGLAGKGDYLDRGIVQDDIDDLKTLVQAVRTMANKVLAHHDRKGPAKFPSLDDLHSCVDFIVKLLQKYQVLLGGRDEDFDAALGDDWTDVFRKPWISEADPTD